MDWLNENAWAVWLGLALTLGAVEAATVDFVFLMLAGGALAGVVASLLGVGVAIQIVVAASVSVALLAGVRPLVKRHLIHRLPTTAFGTEAYAGREAVVLQPVTRESGLVEIDKEHWTARLDDDGLGAPEGTRVTVLRVEGASLIVRAGHPVQDARGPDAS